jgi:hypothetical protein
MKVGIFFFEAISRFPLLSFYFKEKIKRISAAIAAMALF